MPIFVAPHTFLSCPNSVNLCINHVHYAVCDNELLVKTHEESQKTNYSTKWDLKCGKMAGNDWSYNMIKLLTRDVEIRKTDCKRPQECVNERIHMSKKELHLKPNKRTHINSRKHRKYVNIRWQIRFNYLWINFNYNILNKEHNSSNVLRITICYILNAIY